MSRQAFRIVAGIFILGFVVFSIVVTCFWVSLHQNAQDVVESARRGCEFNKMDRGSNADGWETAKLARISAAYSDNATPTSRANDLKAARKYSKIEKALRERQKVVCEQRYPDAKWFNIG